MSRARSHRALSDVPIIVLLAGVYFFAGSFIGFIALLSVLVPAMRGAGLQEVRFRFDFVGTKVVAQS